MTKTFADITHREEFSAAHRLHSPHLSEQENRRLYGPCYTLHGHNYEFEVTVRGPIDERTGMVMDLNVLMTIMREEIVAVVDHKYLNEDVPFLEGVITTGENVAIAIWNQIARHADSFGTGRLHRVRVFESRSNIVDYYGPNA